MRFVDLFCGLGGFHLALSGLGHDCVFACEIDQNLADLYEKNFGFRPAGDIRNAYELVPSHDILCAGFPCQPFSKAGVQLGFGCPDSGDLFDYVIKIVRRHRPHYLLLENVPNILRHNDGESWRVVEARLRNAGYSVDARILSPHQFGVPQNRERAIIVASRSGLADFKWPSTTKRETSIESVLDAAPVNARPLQDTHANYIAVWQRVLDRFPKYAELPSFPIWAMEFGSNYPVDGRSPASLTFKELKKYRGAFGVRLAKASTKMEAINMLPGYAQGTKKFPLWKVRFIQQNRQFYKLHKAAFAHELELISSFPPSFQKLEWNWKNGPKDLWKTVVQFRASGIRAKRTATAPSLVAFTPSQVPVITWQRRYMTMRECARLQSMDALQILPEEANLGFMALGNAVNVRVVSLVAEALFGLAIEDARTVVPRGLQRLARL